ncbi:MAG: ester cyclase [Rhizobiaceae bacterium]|nr:ester cyclase [Rhizobiaceae bacterium]
MSIAVPDAFQRLRAASADFAEVPVRAALEALFTDDAAIKVCHPFGTVTGPDVLYETLHAPLLASWPDLERRDMIMMAGTTAQGEDWIGACGHHVGTFQKPWLDIPPTGHVTALRYHEFYRIEDGRAVEMQAIYDVPDVMMQAGAWPGAPSLGRSGFVLSPMSGDGLDHARRDAAASAASLALVMDMLASMVRHPAEGGPEVMQLERYRRLPQLAPDPVSGRHARSRSASRRAGIGLFCRRKLRGGDRLAQHAPDIDGRRLAWPCTNGPAHRSQKS